MECNKDDAIKAREIAERKFNAKDIAGAKKFALKAQKLYPGLEGIAQLLATLDVYAAAENPVLGEADFYGVLGVEPQADEDTIRKHYRKLALMLHPDKNKSIGAEGAFKLLSEAWSLLSDKNRKASYDARRKSYGFSQKNNPPSSAPPNANGFYNFAKSTVSNSKDNKTRPNGSSSSKANQKNTFWTVCHRCKMQYEYLRNYLNQNLQCPNCRKPFFATETPPPVSGITSWKVSGKEVRDKRSHKDWHNVGSSQWTPFSGGTAVSSVAQAANVVQQTYEKVKRVREEAQAAKKHEMAMKSEKKRRISDDNQMGIRSCGSGISTTIALPKTSDAAAIYASRISKLNTKRELSLSELRSILMHKARAVILNKIGEWKSTCMISNACQDNIKNFYCKDGMQEKALINGDHSLTQFNEIIGRVSVPVLDPDFYDFDKDRTEKAFEENQVWAVYDNHDGMPRFYAMVSSVISRDPLKLQIGWLKLNSNLELGFSNSVGSSFSKACGEFRVGRHETLDGSNCFSHKVRWAKGTQGDVRILPRKGDVWALYRNWAPDWNELTPDDVIHKYDLVEVLDDYDEEQGVVVIPLVKVAGFKAVFRHHLDPKQVRRIPTEEIFRFSFQVPSHVISGQEGSNALKGCRELDPAALPLEFLQVIADAKVEDTDEKHKITEVAVETK